MEVEQTPEMVEEAFYAKEFNFSYSSLNKLLFSPRVFYNQYVLKKKEEKMESYLIAGKVIHCLLLENDKFNDYFIVSPTKLPEGNNKSIVERVFYNNSLNPDFADKEFTDFGKDIIDILLEINLHQTLKTDEQRLDKVMIDMNISYFNFLKSKGNKDIVDAETLEYCLQGAQVFKTNKQVVDLMGLESIQLDTFKIYNEITLQMDLEGLPFGLKGILDNVVVNGITKHIYINDIKTTGKTLADFKDSVEFFNYWMQAAIYTRLVLDYFKDHIDKSWVVTFNFIVIDKNQQVYPFEVKKQTMLLWLKKLNDNLGIALYHYTSRDYNLPYEFATGKIYL